MECCDRQPENKYGLRTPCRDTVMSVDRKACILFQQQRTTIAENERKNGNPLSKAGSQNGPTKTWHETTTGM
jgi:hypothetical protein